MNPATAEPVRRSMGVQRRERRRPEAACRSFEALETYYSESAASASFGHDEEDCPGAWVAICTITQLDSRDIHAAFLIGPCTVHVHLACRFHQTVVWLKQFLYRFYNSCILTFQINMSLDVSSAGVAPCSDFHLKL